MRRVDDPVGLGHEHGAPQRARGAVQEAQALEAGRIGGHGPADNDGVVAGVPREGEGREGTRDTGLYSLRLAGEDK